MVKKILLPFLFLAFFSTAVLAQTGSIKGKVINENGEPIPTANVLLVEITQGTATNLQGEYVIDGVEAGTYTLRVSFVGYQEYTAKVTIGAGETVTQNVTLQQQAIGLEELTVVGYGVQKEGVLTSSISTIKSESIQNVPSVSANSLLQGRSSGVQVSSTSGAPGAGLRIKIRGTTSIAGNSEPLYIIDGVPVQTGDFGMGTGGATTSAMAYLNPDDILSLTVLKDASATAIYGARAANGVVLIKTKRGADRPVQIKFGTYFGSQEAVNTPELVTGVQFETLMNEAAINNGESAPYANPQNAVNTDWADLVFRTGSVQNYNLQISGGNEQVQYAVMGGHFKNIGITMPAAFRRSSGRLNLDLNATDNLKFGSSISYSHTHRNRGRNNDNISGILGGAYFIPSNIPVFQPDGSYSHFSIFANPLAAATEVDFNMNVSRFIGNVFGQYEITDNLSAKMSWSYDNMLITNRRYDNSSSVNGASVNGAASFRSALNNRWSGELTLNYITNIGDHNFNVLLGGSMEERNFETLSATGEQFPSDAFQYLTSAAVLNATSSANASGLASLFGRVQYNYDAKYLATLTVRRDASSRFGELNQWGTFPAVGLGWVISEESFFNVDAISMFKVRASYGITGNQAGIGAYQSLGLWVGSNYGDDPGTVTSQLANPDLKWETTRQFNIGFDLDLFDNRLSFTFNYYKKNTQDLLLAVPVPATSGYTTLVQNFGELSNKGLELAITGDIIQTQNFTWTSTFNIAGNRNMIEELASPFNVYNRAPFRYEEGIPMFSFYFHKQLGVDPQTGAPIFADINGDGQFTINGDRTIVGNANPDFFGGFRNTVNFKQFDLTVFLQYSVGGEQLFWNRFFQEHGGTRNTNFLVSQLDRWQKPGDVTMIPKLKRENYAAGLRPSRFVEDGSYMRLKNLTLGYSMPSSLANQLGITAARIYVTGQNLITVTNYSGLDPEVTATATTTLTKGIEFYTVPHAKTYMVGFNITF